MLLKPLTIAAAGLSAAAAFIFPSELTESAADMLNTMPFGLAAPPEVSESQDMQLACPGCPIPVKDSEGNVQVSKTRPNYLDLTFSIDHLPANDRLMLNGFELYPNPDPVRSTLVAPQRPTPPEEFRGKGAPKIPVADDILLSELGFGLEGHPLETDDTDGLRLIELNLQITQVGGEVIEGIPGVNIRLIKAPGGALIIGWVKQVEYTDLSIAPQQDCDSIICRWKAAVAQQLQRLKGHKCGKMGRVGAHGHHGHPGGRKNTIEIHEHSWEQLFKSFKSHILWPVLVGIAAGVSVSIIVITISTVLVGVWRVFIRGQPFFHRRRRHAGHAHKSAQREAALAADEKAGLMAAQEASYTDEDTKPTEV